MNPVIVDLSGCARCHGDGHPQLEFQPLTFPYVEDSGTEMTHWAPCPTNGEPILFGTSDHAHPSPKCPCDICGLVRRTLATFE